MLVKDVMHGRAVAADPNETLPSAAVMMEELGVKRLPVMQGGRMVGLITDGEIKRRLPHIGDGLSAWEFTVQAGRLRVRDVMRTPVHTLGPDSELRGAVRTMLDRRIGGMPVVDEQGELRGMLTLTDVLRAGARRADPAWGTAGEHMTSEVVTVSADDRLSEAAAKLRESRLRVLPVVEGGMLLGVLHEKDVSVLQEREMAAHGKGEPDELLGDRQVSEVMRTATGTLQADTPMAQVMAKMVELNVHGLPVVGEGSRLLGVVTVSDVLRTVVGSI